MGTRHYSSTPRQHRDADLPRRRRESRPRVVFTRRDDAKTRSSNFETKGRR